MKNRSALILILLAVILGFSCQPAFANPGSSMVKIGTWRTAQTIAPYFYKDFLPQDFKVEIIPFTNPADQKTALLAGSLDMCGTTIAHAIHSAAWGQPIVVVAALCNKSSALVVKNDGQITDVGDLAGKTVAYVPGTMHEILLRETLAKHNLIPEKDVRLIRVDFFDMGAALARGSVDAFLSGEPFPALSVHQGYGRILSYPYFDDAFSTINAGLIVTAKTIEKNPRLVAELVKAHAEATRFLAQNPGQWLERAASFGTPKEVWQKAANNIELAWKIDEAYIKNAKNLGQRMLALGIINKEPDYERLFDLSFVEGLEESLKQQP
ncbi:MAG: NrtA/SsuA/CpmA family ABC transporter substrate-binding protein [Desulfatibacillaceae bacterium]|nr:NrtA/SsuA/CpmA family ABC transporter substrate-binding protein [Desulfatibacillaceae bacterium]